ncbi:nickel pincer cofactor biosynthesis protein LarB [Anabaena sp. FACHB-1237]|uniref:nickel pincer cofactor biosynthesis protein LarB n=1 Tax=Anabaena sp. FACHB-1237 TaxID=2692769 RepID=UPI001681585B|nr:nickel pincer cofactor biosynthesis protein LarB [Anabaena sp. FACHB-1237]MBD2139174.1 nickel pincer cofactor biosynthesis protein LarB [Anabaena sp. FACHB-1237]
MHQPENLRSLLESVANGTITPDTAFASLKDLAYQSVGDFAKIDHHRQLRTGFPEVIWGQDKTVDQIYQIMEVMRDRSSIVMATRIQLHIYAELQKKVRGLQYYPQARICAIINSEISIKYPGKIGIISAGTADLPIAEEAAITAELHGFDVLRLWDVGIAGIHRLLNNRHLLESASVLIVVAGMEGALPSVVAGLVDCPVIAVPTSIGYGANFSGLAPLLTMLNSCAAGIGVVNIDNGFGAAVLAGQILRTSAKLPLTKTTD